MAPKTKSPGLCGAPGLRRPNLSTRYPPCEPLIVLSQRGAGRSWACFSGVKLRTRPAELGKWHDSSGARNGTGKTCQRWKAPPGPRRTTMTRRNLRTTLGGTWASHAECAGPPQRPSVRPWFRPQLCCPHTRADCVAEPCAPTTDSRGRSPEPPEKTTKKKKNKFSSGQITPSTKPPGSRALAERPFFGQPRRRAPRAPPGAPGPRTSPGPHGPLKMPGWKPA